MMRGNKVNKHTVIYRLYYNTRGLFFIRIISDTVNYSIHLELKSQVQSGIVTISVSLHTSRELFDLCWHLKVENRSLFIF